MSLPFYFASFLRCQLPSTSRVRITNLSISRNPLPSRYENFRTGDIKRYTIASLYRIQQIDGLALRWTSQPTWSLSRLIWHNRLYVNDILLAPRYTTRYSKRYLKKRYCSFNRTAIMRPREEYIFPVRCN